jgi:hypothetical protein
MLHDSLSAAIARFLRAIVAVCTTMVAMAGCLSSQDISPPTADQANRWESIEPEDADNPETCIGSAASPLCLLKTLLACAMLGRPELCKEEWWPTERPDWLVPYDDPDSAVFYRVIGARPARVRDIPGSLWIKNSPAKPRVGDVLMTVIIDPCPARTGCGGDDSLADYLYFRLVGDEWRLVAASEFIDR